MIRLAILTSVLLLLALRGHARGEDSVAIRIGAEPLWSMPQKQNSDATNHFYERLRERSENRKFTRWLYKALILSKNKDTLTNINVFDETKLHREHEGKPIANIYTRRGQVFDDGGNFLERLANKTHVLTRDRPIRRDLMFSVGDTVSADLVVRNKYLMRSRSYIYDAEFKFSPTVGDSSTVDMYVYTRDNWSLSGDFRSSANGNSMLEIYDANILGSGNKLSLRTNFNWARAKYGGNVVEYEIPNILGSFFRAKMIAGRDFNDEKYGLGILKNFILPTDYAAGAEYYYMQEPYYMLYQDSTRNVRYQSVDAWSGFSKYIPSIGASVFVTGLYGYRSFDRRPDVAHDINPYFHNRTYALMGAGLYREKFYTSNLIYGYGFKEYLPAGYKFELLSGYTWGEFDQRVHAGINLRGGGFTGIGYLMGGVQFGGAINASTGVWSRNGIDVTVRYISNLFGNSNSAIKVRQFVTLNYTHGWNRDYGVDEIITFTRYSGPRGINEYVSGVNRAVLNTETVLFTPLQPLGCRMAFFAFGDFGLLGYDNNPFKNEFYATMGLGVRMKNERLVFSTVELRLGFAFGKRGLLNADYVTISSLRKVDQFRYIPDKPEAFNFR